MRLGEYNFETNPDCLEIASLNKCCAPPSQDFTIEKTIIYDGYNSKDLKNYHDTALIRLHKNVEFNDYIELISLPLYPEEAI